MPSYDYGITLGRAEKRGLVGAIEAADAGAADAELASAHALPRPHAGVEAILPGGGA